MMEELKQQDSVTLNYQDKQSVTAENRRVQRSIVKKIVWILVVPIFAIVGLIVFGEFVQSLPHPMAQRQKCASCLKNIAAALITYANNNQGRYSDTIQDLYVAAGMTPQVYVCPASKDTPTPVVGTVQQQAAVLVSGSHLSYVYLAKGLGGDASDDTVLAYEPLSNHRDGINVLFGDYHVEWLDLIEAQKFLAAVKPNQAMKWPPTTKTVTK